MPATLVQSTLDNAVEHFRRDGYLVIRGFFNTRQTDAMLDNVRRYIDEVMPGVPVEDKFFTDKDDTGTLFRLENLDKHDDWFDRLKHDNRVTSLIKKLLDDELNSQRVVMFGKLPGGGEATPPHQDGYYFKLTPNEAITCWLPLDPVNAENGSIRYVSGSHLGGLREHKVSEVYGFSLGIEELSQADRESEVLVEAGPGDLVLHHSTTIHRADPNDSDRARRTLGLVYFAQRARQDEKAVAEHGQKMKEQWEKARRQ